MYSRNIHILRYKSSASLFEKLFLRGKRRANDALGERFCLIDKQ